MKTRIIILFFVGLLCSSYDFERDHFTSKNRPFEGIKKITAKSKDRRIWETISIFDKKGFLLQRTGYADKELWSDLKYEYVVTDTTIEIKQIQLLTEGGWKKYRFEKYYFDSLGQWYKYNLCSSDLDTVCYDDYYYFRDNFVYENDLLVSYTQTNFLGISKAITYQYNEKRQKIRKIEIPSWSNGDTTFYTYIYDLQGRLTDYIEEAVSSERTPVYSGVAVWDWKTKPNKFHIRLSNFDKNGNWTRSYYITKKRKVFRSERKIEYW
jgi:hypothetical protein